MAFPSNVYNGLYHAEDNILWRYNNSVWSRQRQKIHRDNNWRINQVSNGGTQNHAFNLPVPIPKNNNYFVNFLVRYPSNNVDVGGAFDDWTVTPRNEGGNSIANADFRKTYFVNDSVNQSYMTWTFLMMMPKASQDIHSLNIRLIYNHDQDQPGSFIGFNVESTVYIPVL